MSCRWFCRALVLAVLVTLAAPAWASAQGTFGRIPASGYSGEPDWQAVIREQEAKTCKSREGGRLVVRHLPISENYESAPDRRIPCKTSDVIAALRDGQPVEPENVVLAGPLALGTVAEPVLQADIPFPRGSQQRALWHAARLRRDPHRRRRAAGGRAGPTGRGSTSAAAAVISSTSALAWGA